MTPQTVEFRTAGKSVLLRVGGELAAALHWGAGVDLGRIARYHAEISGLAVAASLPPSFITSGRFEIAVRNEDGEVLFLFTKARIGMRLSPRDAIEFGATVAQLARRCEEWEKAQEVARDQAILIRTGAPVGLANHAEVMDLALGIARDDRDLRRFLPGGVHATRLIGAPKISIETRTPFELAQAAASDPRRREALTRQLSK